MLVGIQSLMLIAQGCSFYHVQFIVVLYVYVLEEVGTYLGIITGYHVFHFISLHYGPMIKLRPETNDIPRIKELQENDISMDIHIAHLGNNQDKNHDPVLRYSIP